ncbi:papilin-like [Ixodes scapularis]|uniref:papilin-like n=1 Tax=Ixodes scapularis TaxID=6945 RepID=UPI001A9E431A|nr:papilin-like [Ixodes scapularis]
MHLVMLIHIVWILAIARTCTCSSSCQSAVRVDICSLDPDFGNDTYGHDGYFYDKYTDKCLSATLSTAEYDDTEANTFSSLDYCLFRCRKHVPERCFDDAIKDYPIRIPTEGVNKWTYDSDATKCVQFIWKGYNTRNRNIFDTQSDCINKCKVPDLGLCASGFRTNCSHGDELYIWYDYTTQECKPLPPHHCPTHGNAFYTFRECYRRCGRFVENKCKLPIQNMSSCRTLENRYGYNTKTKRCERFLGCEDSGNNFPTAKECWNTCTNEVKHRCLQEPDNEFSGLVQRYYYDIDSDKCVRKCMFRGRVSGDSNLFNTKEECELMCTATFNYEPDSL